MSVYQSNPDAPPDSQFAPGELHHIAIGNAGRLLDPRRTPVTIIGVRMDIGVFSVRLDDFEDKGAVWEIPFERVDRYQFALDSRLAGEADVREFRKQVERFDRPLAIPAEAQHRVITEGLIEAARHFADAWLDVESSFLEFEEAMPHPSQREGSPRLYDDLRRYMAKRGVDDVEADFAHWYVSGPHSGEMVKAHRIVMAELGLASFEGTIIRNPAAFADAWGRQRRVMHIIDRLAFMRSLFARMEVCEVTLYRGMSMTEPLRRPVGDTLVSATFDRAVAEAHFTCGQPHMTGVLMRQRTPVHRLFMTYLETEAMNRNYREAEAVLLCDEAAPLF